MIYIITKNGIKIIQILAGRSNVFLLSHDTSNILIDTSPGNKWDKLAKSLEKKNVSHIDCLVLTHSHFDHAGNASRIKNMFGCPVFIHRAEEQNLLSGEMSRPGGTMTATRLIMKYLAPLFEIRLKCEPCLPDILVDEYFDLSIYGIKAQIIHTPGHSPGSVCVIVDDEVVLAGDTMFGVFKWSVLPPYADNVFHLIKSWGELLKTNCNVFLPSHGGLKSRNQLQKEYFKRSHVPQIPQ